MNLPKAIELLQLDLDDPGSVPIEDLNKAQELGIEALKRIEKQRSMGYFIPACNLPRETKGE